MQPRNKLDNKESCENRLKFLDYLRKGQCTKTIYGGNLLGYKVLTPTQDSQCEKTLAEMREVATECMQNLGYKR